MTDPTILGSNFAHWQGEQAHSKFVAACPHEPGGDIWLYTAWTPEGGEWAVFIWW